MEWLSRVAPTSPKSRRLSLEQKGTTAYPVRLDGKKQVLLVDRLALLKSDHLPRILSNSQLRVYGSDSFYIDALYALGDAVDVMAGKRPPIAEVACQRSEHLARVFDFGSQENLRVQLASEVSDEINLYVVLATNALRPHASE